MLALILTVTVVFTEMAPYIHSLPSSLSPPSSTLTDELEKKNAVELERIDAKIKDAETNMGETDLSEGLREKAGYYCRIGDKVRREEMVFRKGCCSRYLTRRFAILRTRQYPL